MTSNYGRKNRGPSHPIPPASDGPPKNLKDIPHIIPTSGYGVFEWCPQDDGKGKPEAVIIVLQLAGRLDGAEVHMRIKSRKEANRLLEVLERHIDNVWPPPPQELGVSTA